MKKSFDDGIVGISADDFENGVATNITFAEDGSPPKPVDAPTDAPTGEEEHPPI